MDANADLIKRKLIWTRPTYPSYTSVVVEFPVGAGQAVSLLAIHWTIDSMNADSSIYFAALSENPEHELNPPVGVAEMIGNLSLYGAVNFIGISRFVTQGASFAAFPATVVIPLYGMLRPKRQIAVFANIWGGIVGMRGDVYYREVAPDMQVVGSMNRRYGKYRRS